MNNPQRKVILLGGGGHAAVVADAAIASEGAGWTLTGYLDDQFRLDMPLPRLGTISDCQSVLAGFDEDVAVHAAVGDASLRERWLAMAVDRCAATIIHPTAVVSPSAKIEAGVFIGPLAVVNARATVGRGTIVNSGAIVEHDCTVGAFSHIAPGAVLAGGASAGDASLIGCRAVVLPGVCVGDRATLGAGAVATRNVPAGVTALGTPARAEHAVS